MEPVIAFGLACNVMQVIDFSLKIIRLCKEFHAEGSPKESQALAVYSRNLRDVAQEVRGWNRTSQSRTSLTESEARLQELALQCTKSATKLQDELGKIPGIGGTAKGVLLCLRSALRTISRSKTIEKTRVEMMQYQEALQTQVLVHMHSEQARIILEHESEFQKLDHKMVLFLRRFADGQTQMSDLLKLEQDETRLAVRDEGERIRDHIDRNHKLTELTKSMPDVQHALLTSLWYPQMNERWSMVREAHEGTYEWIFDDTADHPWDPLALFLRGEGRLYWARGKPGSGKSSLMKLICTHERTWATLKQSHHGARPTMIKFFFWLVGSPRQRSSNGLWSSLLYQLLDQHETLAQQLHSDLPNLGKKRSIDDWSLKELSDTFCQSAKLLSNPIYVFIDGLDEFDPKEGPMEIIRHVNTLMKQPNVKLCVSSRPDVHLERRFRHFPQLRLEQLTEQDIRKYTVDTICNASMSKSFESVRDEEISEMQDMVVRKADGVFIWVYYALNSLIKGLWGGDNWSELLVRLEQMPSEIMDLYRLTWNRLNEDEAAYRPEAATYFRCVMDWLKWTSAINCRITDVTIVANLSSLRRGILEQNNQVSLADFTQKCRATELRIASRCAGLLEIVALDEPVEGPPYEFGGHHNIWAKLNAWVGPHPPPGYNRCVRFIHRTVYDFLHCTQDGQNIMADSEKSDSESAIFYFHYYLLYWSMFKSKDNIPVLIESYLGTDIWKQIRRLRPDKRNDLIHLLVRSIQHRLNREGIVCSLNGWNFPMTFKPYPAVDYVGFAAACGYTAFVRSFVKTAGNGRKLTASYLDYLLLCASNFGMRATWRAVDSDTPGLLDSFMFIQELLDQGADPNFKSYHGQQHDGYYHGTTPMLNFVNASSVLDFDSDPDLETAWQRTMHRFIQAGANFNYTVPILINPSVSARGFAPFGYFLPSWTLDGSPELLCFSMLVDISLRDLIQGISQGWPDSNPSVELEVANALQQPRVRYLRKPPTTLPSDGNGATQFDTTRYLKIAARTDSDILCASMRACWKTPGIYHSEMDDTMREISHRSQKLDSLQEIYEKLLAEDWISEIPSFLDINEPFESEAMEETIPMQGNDRTSE